MPRCYDTDIIAEQRTLTFSLNNDKGVELAVSKGLLFD
jgi:hypothetical protein